MIAIATWQFVLLCLFALPTAILALIAGIGWAVPTVRQSLSNMRDTLAHAAMLRREHRRGNWQQFLHD